MYGYSQQLDRVKRFLVRIEDQDRDQTTYEDDLWSFFQNCWHLKDWIKNDSSISQDVRDVIEYKVKNYNSLLIVADLANRSKHFQLRPKSNRVDADVKNVGVKLHIQTLNLDLGTGETTGGEVLSEYQYTILTDDGSEYDALDLARDTVRDWEQLITKLDI